MRTILGLGFVALLATVLSPNVLACGGGNRQGGSPGFAQMGEMNPQQLAMQQAQFAIRQQQIAAQQQQMIAQQREMLRQFDTDQDGKVSTKERLAAKRREKEARIAAKQAEKASRIATKNVNQKR